MARPIFKRCPKCGDFKIITFTNLANYILECNCGHQIKINNQRVNLILEPYDNSWECE